MPRFLPAILLLMATLVGCGEVKQVLESAIDSAGKQGRQRGPQPAVRSSTERPADAVRIASFNIQVFGQSKSKKPQVMQVLADVVRRFDVVAIQEFRSKDQSIIDRFVRQINSDGANYASIVGPRLGRTSSKEQYIYIYDTDTLEGDSNLIYTVADPADLLHREPLVARFRVRGPPSDPPFTFTLVNIHTDPDETDQELDALADVFRSVQENGSGEDDVILLGDLNVDEYDLGRLGELPGIAYAVTGVTTNTRQTKSYDNLVFDARATREYTGRWGVLNLMQEYGLSEEEALDVSDHLPVWAEFRLREAPNVGPVAARPAATTVR